MHPRAYKERHLYPSVCAVCLPVCACVTAGVTEAETHRFSSLQLKFGGVTVVGNIGTVALSYWQQQQQQQQQP